MEKKYRINENYIKNIIFFIILTFLPYFIPSSINAFLIPFTPYSKESFEAFSKTYPPLNLYFPAHSALLIEPETGFIIYQKDPYLPCTPASIVKMMTILLTAEGIQKEEISLQDYIHISILAQKMGGSQIYLRQGEMYTVEDLIYATTVASANDAAMALAEYIGETKDKFVMLMNQRAFELGMYSTNFFSPNGLPPVKDGEWDMTNAWDLSLLAREMLKNPLILEWTSTKSYSFQKHNSILTINNTNPLLRRYDGMDGLKTGYTRKAGFCLVATAKREDLRILAVILGAKSYRDRTKITRALLDYGFEFFYQYGEFLKQDGKKTDTSSLNYNKTTDKNLSVQKKNSKQNKHLKTSKRKKK